MVNSSFPITNLTALLFDHSEPKGCAKGSDPRASSGGQAERGMITPKFQRLQQIFYFTKVKRFQVSTFSKGKNRSSPTPTVSVVIALFRRFTTDGLVAISTVS